MVSFRAHLAGTKVKTNIQHSTFNIQNPISGRSQCLSMLVVGCWLLVVLLFLGNKVLAADTNAVLDGWFAAQKNLHSWSADFVQTRVLKTLTQPLTATGHVDFAMPDQFRWEIGKPGRTIAVGGSGKMFVVYPLLKRAERYPLGQDAPKQWRDMMSLLQAGFPHSRKEFETQFLVLSLAGTNGVWQFAVQPRSQSVRQMMPEMRLGVATNDYSLVSTEMIFVDGSRMRNDFTNAVLNPGLDKQLFDWQPPADFKIVEPLSP
jgi:outer membrane lipoprotein-sorting protein